MLMQLEQLDTLEGALLVVTMHAHCTQSRDVEQEELLPEQCFQNLQSCKLIFEEL